MSRTYIIAEAGSNHNGDYTTAIKLIDVAKESECDAVKFQLFKSSELYAKNTPDFANYTNINNMMEQLEMPIEWVVKLKEYCKNIGIDFIVTPFDKSSVDYLDSIDIAKFKISGFESTDTEFVQYVLSKKKPTIITVGIGHDLDSIDRLINDTYYTNTEVELTFLHCNHSYPTPFEDLKLNTIDKIYEFIGTRPINVGFSDHSIGTLASIAAVSKGATVIEKHFTMDRTGNSPDNSFSLLPHELKNMVDEIRKVELMLGIKDTKISNSEEDYKMALRGIYATKNILENSTLTYENVITKRPLYKNGIPAGNLKNIINKQINKNIQSGEAILLGDLV